MSIVFPAALRLVAACAIAWVGLSGTALSHEGHSHGDETALLPVTAAAPRAEARSERYELVAAVQGHDLVFYLDAFETNAPITDATLALSTPDGRRTAELQADGSYRLSAPWLEDAAHHDLIAAVTAEGSTDILSLDLDLPTAKGAATKSETPANASLVERFTHQPPSVTAAGGFLLGLGAVVLFRRRRTIPIVVVLAVTATIVLGSAALAHEGHDAAPAEGGMMASPPAGGADRAKRLGDGSIFVPKSLQRLLVLRTAVTATESVARTVALPGRVIADPNASGVVQSSVGGRLAPPANGFPRLGTRVTRGEVLATVTPPVQAVDVSDMRQRQGELDQQIAILDRRVVRFERLAGTGAVARTQLDDARSERDGLKDRRAALDAVRGSPEALVAPVDGVIAEASATAGAMAASGTVVFRIVDPGKLWVEALSFEALSPEGAATARLGDGRSLALTYRGAGLADRNQAVPVQFAVAGDPAGLRLGQFVTVHAPLTGERTGLAVPRSGILRAEGGSVVYEHVGAERFVARAVRTDPLDADRTLIAGGLEPGRRVVVQGAELLDQIR
ncbi:efflux RND transporter periplasmic adaptor subunit [Methylobacterium sp. E-045]|uniref:efflux RND transporter periplasmic adaptor subunit n=1 Tax=Methylobacterium sp. E-045 TaxID=2836575 RepID=UPI001FBA2B55|nr:HlyD family efflux transporter periplasmic adaptor subunit [Methylobacterium sp. E-045]MCJ2128821.1 HlyD family efflux transporter periplasmic adaptor subunit [Methylobacterium sp. E-045]